MGAEEALRDPAVLLAGERHAVALEVVDAAGRALGDDLDRARVGEQVALLEGVGGVLLPGVLGVHRGERRVDAAGGERRVGVRLGALADGEDVDARLGELDRRAQARTARADHEDGRGDLPLGSGAA